jgi:hypothetical protein
VHVDRVLEQDARLRLVGGELRAGLGGAPLVSDDGALIGMLQAARAGSGAAFALMGSAMYACLREANLLQGMAPVG